MKKGKRTKMTEIADESKIIKKKQLPWLKELAKEISTLGSMEVVPGSDFLRIVKLMEKRCLRESKILKTAKKARKLMTGITGLLRSLKLVSYGVEEGKVNVKSSFSLILMRLVAIAASLKEPELESRPLYQFMKALLDSDANWILITILATLDTDDLPAAKSLKHSLLSLAMNDPVLVSAKEVVIQKALCGAALLLKIEGFSDRSKQNVKIHEGWVQENLLARCKHCDTRQVIQNCKRKLKIKIPASALKASGEIGTSSVGIGWSLSTAPAELPADFVLTDSEAEDEAGDDKDASEDNLVIETRAEGSDSEVPAKRSKLLNSNSDDSDKD